MAMPDGVSVPEEAIVGSRPADVGDPMHEAVAPLNTSTDVGMAAAAAEERAKRAAAWCGAE